MPQRAGYTLLEVLLAIGIGLLIVAGLYVILNIQVGSMDLSRNLVGEAQLARGLMNRVARDVRLSLARLPGQASSTTQSTSTATTTTDPAATTGTDTATESTTTGTQTTPTQFNQGLVGSEQELMLFVSGVPRYGVVDAQTQLGASDQRVVRYSVVPGVGLIREEGRIVLTTMTVEDLTPTVLATEVLDLRFEYYDATTATWMGTWDGTTNGPPMAVRFTMTFQPPTEAGRVPPPATTYSQVVAIPGAGVSQEWVNSQAGTTTPME